jgi:RNA polymerase sigma factor (sigma-70 family)
VASYLRGQGVADPDDLVNEVFLGAFSKLGDFEGGEAQFRSFLFTIAHHRLVDHRRRQARRRDDPTDQVAEGTTGHTEDDALARLGAGDVRELLASLAPDQRDVLLLRIIADLTVEEVARTLAKRPGAVKALQRRGLAALRRKISTQGVPLEG